MVGLVIVALVVAGLIYLFLDNNRRKKPKPILLKTSQLLEENIPFYVALSPENKLLFENRVTNFLENITITGVDVAVEDIDRILIAAGAITLIFAFPDWKYNNLSEVLLYKGTFNQEYDTDKGERNILGMVGDGVMNRKMILSKPSLHASYSSNTDGHNTVIHEFAHLIDKADGLTDGIPEYLLTQPHLIPWANEIKETIKTMKGKSHSDINQYGATNDAEFFAVITEYFIERPEKLKDHHPELYEMLKEMYGGK